MRSPIVIVQPHLEYGGAERQTVLVANRLVQMGYECHVVLHEAKGGLVSSLNDGVNLHDLGLESHLATPVVARRLKMTLSQIAPAYVIVKLWSSILACALVESGLPQHAFNYCEDLDPTDHAKFIRFGRLKQFLISRIFKSRTTLTANTHQVAQSMVDVYGLGFMPDVIYSTVDPTITNDLAVQDVGLSIRVQGSMNVISVGSLIPRKGVMQILEILQRLPFPVAWHVVGEGPLRDVLSSAATKSSNVKINLLGGTANPYRFISQADVLLHNAASEAFGIVILEAISLGVPVVASGAIGPKEIQQKLGRDDRFLRIYEIDDVEGSLSHLQDLYYASNASDATTVESRSYISPYLLQSSVDRWIARAEAAVKVLPRSGE